MAADVLLVSVPVGRAVQHRDEAPSKYLGIAYVAASLEAHGVRVKVIDARGERLDHAGVVARVRDERPRMLGITAMTHEIVRAGALAREIKRIDPECVTVVGGAHATALPAATIEQFPGFDVACGGEGEETAVELWETVSGGRALASVRGIAWRDGTRAVLNACREPPGDLDGMQRPAWHLFPWTPFFPVYSARGCPYQCNFCMRALGSRYRSRTAENVVDEIEWLVTRHGAQRICFEDETFMIDRRRTFRMMDLLIARGLHQRMQWSANLHARTVEPALVTRMREAGCVSVGTGIESGNPSVLSAIGKGLTVPIARESVRTLKAHGLEVRAFFIFGHPHETRATALDTIRLASELNPDHASFGIMVPYPNTEVATMVERGEGGYRLLSLDWSDYDKYLGHALELVALPRHELELLQGLAYVHLYLTNGRWRDLARFAWRHRRAAYALLWRIGRGIAGRLLIAAPAPFPESAAPGIAHDHPSGDLPAADAMPAGRLP